MKFDRHFGSSAVDVPVKFQNDTTIQSTNLVASRLYEIIRKDVFSDIETGPWQEMCHKNGEIYPKEMQLNIENVDEKKETFLDHEQEIHNNIIHVKTYDKWETIKLEIINYWTSQEI